MGSGTGQTMNSWVGKIGRMEDMVYAFVQGTLALATPSGVQHMEDTIQEFLDDALEEVLSVVHAVENNNAECVQLGGAWSKLKRILDGLKPVLPVAIDGLRTTRRGVDVVATVLDNTFTMLAEQHDPFYIYADFVYDMAHYYHLVTVLLTTAMLLMNLWAAGVVKWPTRYCFKPERDEDAYVAPQTFSERLAVCKTCCLSCLTKDPVHVPLVFWSLLILLDIIVLATFWVVIAYDAVLGFSFFVHVGCKQIYPIEDIKVCHDVMSWYGQFMGLIAPQAFYQEENVCAESTLVTCRIFKDQVESQMFYIVVCGFFASFFSYQLLVDSAMLHEQARWNMALSKLEKKD
jgi:hypothetical protein